jgi:predicted RNase H-like nuclease (RuvC/YqgF family)
MSRGGDDESEAERRLRSELEARDEEVARLKHAVEDEARTIETLRGSRGEDAAKIHQLEEESVETHRIERAQRALIDELRTELGDVARDAESIRGRLTAAELELVTTCAACCSGSTWRWLSALGKAPNSLRLRA